MIHKTARFVSLVFVLGTAVILTAFGQSADEYLTDQDQGNGDLTAAALKELQAAGPNAAEVYLAYPPEVQELVRDALTAREIKPASGKSQLVAPVANNGTDGASCWEATAECDGFDLPGLVVWRFFSRVNWCDDGSVITYAAPSAWGQPVGPFWEYRGANISSSGGSGFTWYQSVAQGHFALCFPIVGCVQYSDPAITVTVYPGGWADATGC